MKRKLLLIGDLLKQTIFLNRKKAMLCVLTLLMGLSVMAGTHNPVIKKTTANHRHKKSLIASPTLSYNSTNSFGKGVPIAPLTPVSSGVGAPGYNPLAFIGQTLITSLGGVVADAAGNVYISSRATIYEIPAGGGPATTIGSGFSDVGALAIDAAGDVFVVDDQNIKEVLSGNTGTITIGTTGNFSSPHALALDGAGNLYVADGSPDVPGIKEFQYSGGVYSSNYIMIGSGFNMPNGVAVDAAGNVYVADYGNSAIKEIAAGNGAVTTITPFAYPLSITIDASRNLYVAGSGETFGYISELPVGHYTNPVKYGSGNIGNPGQLWADASGDVYLNDSNHGAVKEIPAGNGIPVTIAPGFNNPEAVAVDAAGNVFVADAYSATVKEIPAAGSTYPHILAPDFNFGLPLGVAVDAADNVYVGDQTTIYKITPGAATPVVIASGFNSTVECVAIDTKGNVYACTGGTAIYKIAAGGNAVAAINSSFTSITSIAADAAGNVYAYDGSNSNVYKIPYGGSGTPVVMATFPGFGFAGKYLAVDASGNVYLSFRGNGTPSGVDEIAASNGTVTQVANTLSQGVPTGVAIDGAGNLYVADYNNTSYFVVDKITPGGGYYLNNPLPPGLTFNNTTGVISGTPTALWPATNYTVTAYGGGGSAAATFSIQVGTPQLTITANNQTKIYGSANPALTIGYSGFTPGNSPASLTTQPTISTTATTNSPVGTYPITVSGAVDPNYNITYVQGTLTVAPSTNALLSNLTVSNGGLSPGFGSSKTSYTTVVSGATASITVTPTTSDPNATVTVNTAMVTSGSPSAAIALNVGANVIPIVVTAQDGSTTDTYTLTVTRQPSSDAKLAFLGLSQVLLSPTFAEGTTSYTASVPNSLASVNVLPITVDPTATVTVNTVTVASGASTAVALSVGANTINAVVTAQDGTMLTYSVIVTRAPSSVATLSNLTLSNGGMTPGFGSAKTSYTAVVGSAITSITETPTTTDPTATVTVNGATVTSGTPSAAIALSVGGNTITTVVTAQDGTTDTYTVMVTRAASSNAKLGFLGLSHVVLSPAFNNAITSYTAIVPNTLTTTNVLPIVVDATATIAVNGVSVASGASTPIALNPGINVINTVVTAQDGTQLTYTVTVTRGASTNAYLSSLNAGGVTLSPAFVYTTYAYTGSAPYGTASTTLTANTTDPTATLTLNGNPITSASANTETLAVGANTFTFVVTAQDGVTTETYTVVITEAGPSTNAYLNTLVTNASDFPLFFQSNTFSYQLTTFYTQAAAEFDFTLEDPTATVTINGQPELPNVLSQGFPLPTVGMGNIFTIIVTAQDGVTTQTYTLNIARQPALSNIVVSQVTLSPVFSDSNYGYDGQVNSVNPISSVTVTPTAAEPNATITANGVSVASGATTAPIAIAVADDPISVVVTAADGVTSTTYTVTVDNTPGEDNSLYQPISVATPPNSPQLNEDGIMVHQGVSPNGDGIEDFLQIDGITQYPDNKLAIINLNGALIYETKGYDNSSRVFDGRSNKTGQMQLPGTYFFSLDYAVKGVAKHKTGFIVLKY